MRGNMGEFGDILLEDLEGLLREINEFSSGGSSKPEDIPQSLDRYLQFVAKSGNIVFPWQHVRPLFRTKIMQAMEQFPGETCPSSEAFVMERFDMFRAAPFTIQRLAELVINPARHYKKKEKFLRGLEKTVLVVSTVEPWSLDMDMKNGNDSGSDGEMDQTYSESDDSLVANRTFDLDPQDMLMVGGGDMPQQQHQEMMESQPVPNNPDPADPNPCLLDVNVDVDPLAEGGPPTGVIVADPTPCLLDVAVEPITEGQSTNGVIATDPSPCFLDVDTGIEGGTATAISVPAADPGSCAVDADPKDLITEEGPVIGVSAPDPSPSLLDVQVDPITAGGGVAAINVSAVDPSPCFLEVDPLREGGPATEVSVADTVPSVPNPGLLDVNVDPIIEGEPATVASTPDPTPCFLNVDPIIEGTPETDISAPDPLPPSDV